MQKITIHVEAISPFFMGGAYQRTPPFEQNTDHSAAPEIRPPSIRGAMRFWYRAMAGGCISFNDMHKSDMRIFGSAGDSESGSGDITTRVKTTQMTKSDWGKFSTLLEGEFTEVEKSSIKYLFFSARSTKYPPVPERSGWLGRFDLILSARPGRKESVQSLREAYAAFWLLSRLGGLGSRARRGGGNFTAEADRSEELDGLPGLEVTATTPQELAEQLGQDIKKMRDALYPGKNNSHTDFDIISPGSCEIFVIDKVFDNFGSAALAEFGSAFMGFRKNRGPDVGIVLDALDNPKKDRMSGVIQRTAFGLPINFFFLETHKSITLEGEKKKRRSSPLIVRVLRLADAQKTEEPANITDSGISDASKTNAGPKNDQRYALVLTWFKSDFLPGAEDVVLKSAHGAVASSNIIDQFINDPAGKEANSLKGRGLNVIKVSL